MGGAVLMEFIIKSPVGISSSREGSRYASPYLEPVLWHVAASGSKVVMDGNSRAYGVLSGLTAPDRISCYRYDDKSFTGFTPAAALISLTRKLVVHSKCLIVIADDDYGSIDPLGRVAIETAVKQYRPLWVSGIAPPHNALPEGLRGKSFWVSSTLGNIPGYTYAASDK